MSRATTTGGSRPPANRCSRSPLLAMAVTMTAAILGASVDTGVLPSIVHGAIAYGAIVCNLAAVKIEIGALIASSRIVDRGQPPDRLVTPPVLDARRRLQGLSGSAAAPHPAACRRRRRAGRDPGFDQPSAEVFVNLVTGAMLPDAGRVACSAARRRTSRTAPTGSRWSIASASSASARCCSISCRSSRISRCRSRSTSSRRPRRCEERAVALASEVGLAEAAWNRPVAALDPAGRVRVTSRASARARSRGPAPRARERRSRCRCGTTARRATSAALPADAVRQWWRSPSDDRFAALVATRVLALAPATGRLTEARRGWLG